METFISWLRESPLTSEAPRYVQLAQRIEEAIREERLAVGDFLPAERRLAERLGLSRVTISKAMALLEEKKMVLRRQGLGTQVIHTIDYSLNQDQGFTAQLSGHFREVTNQWLRRSVQHASLELSQRLGLIEGEQLATLRRIRLADGIPVSIENTYIPLVYLPDPQRLEGSLYAYWKSSGIVPHHRSYRLRAVACSAEVASLLDVEVNAPLLAIEQTSYDEQGHILEVSEILCRSDLYEFAVQSVELALG